MKLNWKEMIGKKVFITTSKGNIYTGVINETTFDGEFTWVHITDKFDKLVVFLESEIVGLVEK